MARRTILVVDDNSANRRLVQCALEAVGYEVRAAVDAEEALAILRSLTPDLVLMDIQLPGLDGLEATRRIKADKDLADIPVVALTAYAMKGDRERALEAGCDDYITKPIDPIELPAYLERLLDRRSGGTSTAPVAPTRVSLENPPRTQRRVLLVEDNATTRKMYRAVLEHAGLEVLEAGDGATALACVVHTPPDVVVQDLVLPDIEGLDLADQLRELLPEGVPILCVSGFLSQVDEAFAASGGFAQVLVKPIDPFAFVDAVRAHASPSGQGVAAANTGRRILLVDDDAMQRRLAQAWLSGAGYRVLTASDGEEALAIALRDHPDVIVSDVLMPTMDGFSFCHRVRSHPSLAKTPLVLVSSAYREAEDKELARKVGANALLSRSDGFDAVIESIEAAFAKEPEAAVEAALETAPRQIDHEVGQRTLWQLERQIQENTRLFQRLALQESQLAVLAGVAEALAESRVVRGALGSVLEVCLDTAGISKGVLYLIENDRLELVHQIGFAEADRDRLTQLFGHSVELTEIARRGRVIVVPSQDLPEVCSRKLVDDFKGASLLLVPVSWSLSSYGLMMLGGRSADIRSEDALTFARVLGAQMGLALGMAQTFTNLGASELRYRTLTENANDAVFTLTPDGVIREANQRLGALLGEQAEHLIGRHVRTLVAPTHQEVSDAFFRVTAPDRPRTRITLPLRPRDGSYLLVEFSTAIVQFGDETIIYSIGRDVTEQMRAQAQLMVSDRMASIGTLAAGVAHEINNPLAAVLANLDLALKDSNALVAADPALPHMHELRVSLEEAREAAERVRQIVKDLRLFSHADEEERSAVDVRRALESTLRMAWNEIRHRARLTKNFARVPLVHASEGRLGQVFLNLVINAAQSIPEGRSHENDIVVSTSVDARGRVMVEVRDTGAGIPPEQHSRLFTPFFTTKPPGVGTGLGLPICQRIVNSLGGEITFESEVGSGSTFRVHLPASREEVPAVAPPQPAPVARSSARVLVIDDDPAVGGSVHRALSEEHDVTVLTAAQEALDRINAGQRFDLILCDLMMSAMSGIEFFECLRTQAPEQAELVVFMSGDVTTPRARQFLDRVPNARMEKPFAVQNLRALVASRAGRTPRSEP